MSPPTTALEAARLPFFYELAAAAVQALHPTDVPPTWDEIDGEERAAIIAVGSAVLAAAYDHAAQAVSKVPLDVLREYGMQSDADHEAVRMVFVVAIESLARTARVAGRVTP